MKLETLLPAKVVYLTPSFTVKASLVDSPVHTMMWLQGHASLLPMFLFLIVFLSSMNEHPDLLVESKYISDLNDLTFYDGQVYSFNISRNYIVLNNDQINNVNNAARLLLLDVSVYNGINKVLNVGYESSSYAGTLTGCQMYDSNSIQVCATHPSDFDPFLILDVGTQSFDRVVIRAYQDAQVAYDHVLGGTVQFWKGKSLSSPSLLHFHPFFQKMSHLITPHLFTSSHRWSEYIQLWFL